MKEKRKVSILKVLSLFGLSFFLIKLFALMQIVSYILDASIGEFIFNVAIFIGTVSVLFGSIPKDYIFKEEKVKNEK